VGVKKALKALTRPIREIADAIQRQDNKLLTTLPGVGPSTAEQIVATLRRKVTKFALMRVADGETPAPAAATADDVWETGYQALLSVGHSPGEARDRLEKLRKTGKAFASVEELLMAIYAQGK
jgi:Holliday junction DNA helicase RuvA